MSAFNGAPYTCILIDVSEYDIVYAGFYPECKHQAAARAKGVPWSARKTVMPLKTCAVVTKPEEEEEPTWNGSRKTKRCAV